MGEEEGDSVVREGNEKESVAGVTLLDVNSVYTSSLLCSFFLTRARSAYVQDLASFVACFGIVCSSRKSGSVNLGPVRIERIVEC